MPEWLRPTVPSNQTFDVEQLAIRLVVGLLLGGVVALIYYFTSPKPRAEQVPFLTTLVLLTILIAMVTQVIGDNAARAFSLVGALAIIRFRTVVEDTRDTAFVIFSVVVGMAVGADYVIVALIGIPIIVAALLVLRLLEKPSAQTPAADSTLAIRLGLGRSADGPLTSVLARHVERSRLIATITARQGAALELTYVVRLRQPDQAVAFVTDLNALEGVQAVELRQTQ